MSHHYSDPKRENDPHALPNVEVFYVSESEFIDADEDTWMADVAPHMPAEFLAGWYYWFCFPGCLPDSEPTGPFDTEQLAIEAAQDEDEG